MNIENRLSKLEAKAPTEDDWKVFRVIGCSDEEIQADIDRLIASGEARPIDRFFCRIARFEDGKRGRDLRPNEPLA